MQSQLCPHLLLVWVCFPLSIQPYSKKEHVCFQFMNFFFYFSEHSVGSIGEPHCLLGRLDHLHQLHGESLPGLHWGLLSIEEKDWTSSVQPPYSLPWTKMGSEITRQGSKNSRNSPQIWFVFILVIKDFSCLCTIWSFFFFKCNLTLQFMCYFSRSNWKQVFPVWQCRRLLIFLEDIIRLTSTMKLVSFVI